MLHVKWSWLGFLMTLLRLNDPIRKVIVKELTSTMKQTQQNS